ncbi:PREDICTED: protein O-mannosyltransferase 1-like, partial [Rhagoletis zephyria]|uniref:protein O-mannosyltransferase 1-like n=1 Tax=Rhagoletis zephyria TaxID=28612 RepID=UPI0008119257
MVFLKNNTGGESSQQQKSSNLKPQAASDQVLNNRLPKKDINMLTAKQTSATSANSVADSESQQPKANKKTGEDEMKRDNHSAASDSSSKVGVESANPFTVKLEINIVVVALFAVALGLRLYAIDQPNSVVFDELHYGRFVSLYLKGIFFFDSQPPLGKQLISLSAHLSGFQGNFADNFTSIGQDYDSNVPIRALRFMPALCGAILVPIAYQIVVELGLGHKTALLTSLLLICENSILTQSRFILLDTILMFFSFSGLLSYLMARKRPTFSGGWSALMATSGLLLACGVCVKYIGIFTLLQVQMMAFADVYLKIADKTIRTLHLWLEFLLHLVAFILLPLLVYCLVFYVHLSILVRAGPHDNIMTSAFQASLDGGLASIIKGQPRDIAHGSQITLRNTHGRTCWLHSHQALYPIRYPDKRGSSHQQQVTCYSFKDVNNWWIVKRPNIDELITHEPRDNIKDGDVIQLVHGLSGRALNSHDIAAPVSPYNQEVSCYIDYNISMVAQNFWQVKLLNGDDTGGYWHAINSRLQLIHLNSSQALKMSGLQLPAWGFHQHEVVTDKAVKHPNTVWNVEEHRYTKSAGDEKELERELGAAEFVPLGPTSLSFWEKMAELQYKMLVVNAEAVQNHMYSTESPVDWLLLTKGIAYWLSPSSNAQIYLIGNITIWYLGLAAIALYWSLLLFYLLRRARLKHDIDEEHWNRFLLTGQVAAVGYLLHFLPYFLCERTLFLHYYLPALLFKIILTAAVVSHLE